MKLFLVIILAITFIAIKIYMLRKKSLKNILRQKLIVTFAVSIIFSILWLSFPGLEFINPKNIVMGYVSEFLKN